MSSFFISFLDCALCVADSAFVLQHRVYYLHHGTVLSQSLKRLFLSLLITSLKEYTHAPLTSVIFSWYFKTTYILHTCFPPSQCEGANKTSSMKDHVHFNNTE